MSIVKAISVGEAATAEQLEVVQFLKDEHAKIFPKGSVWVGLRNILGETRIHIRHINAASSQDCAHGIDRNDPAYMYFSIWGNPKEGYYIERPNTRNYDTLKRVGVKRFVTIKAATETECAIKLRDWLKKNAAGIIALD